MMNPFVQAAPDDVHTYPATSTTLSADIQSPSDKKWSLKRHPRSGGLLVDDHFRVKLVPRNESSPSSEEGEKVPEATLQDVFAIGDVSVMEKSQLPATAQIANQEAKWLGKATNNGNLSENVGFKESGGYDLFGEYEGDYASRRWDGSQGENGVDHLARSVSDADGQLEEQVVDSYLLVYQLDFCRKHLIWNFRRLFHRAGRQSTALWSRSKLESFPYQSSHPVSCLSHYCRPHLETSFCPLVNIRYSITKPVCK
ncbi:hypothetical protein WAI453_004428 [Rhynchosporium graminicola]